LCLHKWVIKIPAELSLCSYQSCVMVGRLCFEFKQYHYPSKHLLIAVVV
jgi:hypothetical protein